MDDYAGRVLADRYRLPLPPSDAYELAETRAFDTYSGQEVLVRQVPLPEIVEAEFVDMEGLAGSAVPGRAQGRSTRRPADPAVRRAMDAAQAAAQIPDHPRLDQVFDVFAEDGSLWIVSERVAARPLAALLAEKPLTPYRAAEVASDVLTALRVLHAHGWTHRNITARTVLVCDDGRVVLTGLASGAAEEALCGYAPVPAPVDPDPDHDHDHDDGDDDGDFDDQDLHDGEPADGEFGHDGHEGHDDHPHGEGPGDEDYSYGEAGEGSPERAALESPHSADPYATPDPYLSPDLYPYRPPAQGAGPGTGTGVGPGPTAPGPAAPGPTGTGSGTGVPDIRAARAGAIAAYRAGARAAARVSEDLRQGDRPVQTGNDPDWWAAKPGERVVAPAEYHTGHADDADDEADDDEFDDDYGAGGPGRPRLAGTWHDGPLPGQDGPAPLSAGGGGPARHPQSDNDPYGVDPYGVRQALPGGSHRPDPGAGRGTGRGGSGDPYRDRPALPAPRSGTPDPYRPALPHARPGGSPTPVPAPPTGSWDRGGAGREALRADSQRRPVPAAHSAGGWDEVVPGAESPAYQGPSTPLAAERARQARIAVVGAVTERWAPEQAGPVHENWQLAAPVGPATDLWALGALLYRSVQGHAPYPEESAYELVQLVCAEPPAFAEECGPLRPVVESLLRQDPTERPDFEELRGWLRSLVRSAPEPEAGMDVVAVPSSVVDGSRLPVVRRRGELVRKRRTGSTEVVHGRHRHKKSRRERRGPRSLGRLLLLLILLLLVAAIAYAMVFMPRSGTQQEGAQGTQSPAPTASAPGPGRTEAGTPPPPKASGTPGSQQPQTSAPAGNLPAGYALRSDPEGFRVAVPTSWQRRPINDSGQVRYSDGDFTLIVVPGRDSVQANGDDPLVYQRDKERELQPFRDSSWAASTGLRRIDVGRQAMAEGQFTWQDSSGREVYVRNLAMIVGGRYHVVQVIGPEDQRDKVTEAYSQAVEAYRATG